jgi:phosphate transport system substrate-binding protein
MFKSFAITLTATLLANVAAQAGDISGAGATFPAPVYAKWAEAYRAQTGVGLNYQAIGSGGGIKQIEAGTVDFGATDKPLSVDELTQNGLVQWPMVMGGVVPVVHIAGINAGDIKLTGAVLADIYLGTITKWNDAAIIKLNPSLKLPSEDITVIARSDGSGTTFNFTNYLAAVSADWKSKVGVNTAVQWPVGLSGKGNEGVANYVAQLDGTIGYVEYAYALQNKLAYTQLQNKEGNYVSPTAEGFSSAAANADWEHTAGYGVVLGNQPGAKSWPITAATFILVHAKNEKPDSVAASLKFFDWSFKKGQQAAADLSYVPMPDSVVALIEKTWAANIKDASGAALWPAK